MQIRELRIAGFKSFVDPETVPIEPGLTGIVGPNGCGKSNLLEALRWAMGATSAKAMRGDEMDDLIFNGAAGRPARELAEVTLVLDNQDRTAPAEFNQSDTLEVVRRLKRGAGSTYKLNGRTVRGKDIKLIFADASTGANSPSLVRQGQISELIAAKPQNRRRLLEEAAGIAGLNTRRHEAELKLQGAETNLERLTEITAEVERQLESLRRQARKARKYRALSNQIQALEAYAAHLRWQKAKQDKIDAETALAEARITLERVTRDVAIAETRHLDLTGKLGPLREAESLASGRLGQVRIDHARVETELRNAIERVAELEQAARRLGEDLVREQAQKEEAEQNLEDAQSRLDALPDLDPSMNDQKEAAARQFLEAARAELETAQAAADEANQLLSEKRAEKQALESNLRLHVSRRDQLEREQADLQEQLDAVTRDLASNPDLERASHAQQAADAAFTNAEEAVLQAEQKLDHATRAEAEARPAYEAARDAARTLETEISGLKRLLRTSDMNDAPAVMDSLHISEGFEKAVGAALGDDLRAPTDRSASMFWGGAAPVDTTLPAGVQPLSDLVNGPAELDARLAQCGVVSEVEGPRLAALLLPGQRLVSRAGHLWRWDGYVRTPDAPVSATERLEQQARLEMAEQELVSALQACEKAQQVFDQARSQRQLAEQTLRSAQSALKDARTAREQAAAEISRHKQAQERMQMRVDSLTDRLSRIEPDLAHAREAIADSGRSVDEDLIRRLTEAATAAQLNLSQCRDAETEARGQLTDLTRNREQALARRMAVEEDVERWTRRLEASRNRHAEIIDRIEAARSDLTTAQERPGHLKQQTESLAARVDALETDRKRAADALAEQERDVREADAALRSASNLAMSSRETLAITNARRETAEQRLLEIEAHARAHFQRQPDGLLALARGDEVKDLPETEDLAEVDRHAERLRLERENLGGVNMEAEAEAEELETRLGFQTNEKEDLVAAISRLRNGIAELNEEGRARLIEAFEQVNDHFKTLFRTLFRGGEAELRLVDADDPLNAGLEIMAQPPGKRLGTLSLMSGGEQALTATALIFAVFLSRPAPICVLDEVDAPLDDANVDRFCRMLDEMRQRTKTRFIIITHNPVTMSRMDRLFGVTMREQGVSKLVSVDLNAAEELVAAE